MAGGSSSLLGLLATLALIAQSRADERAAFFEKQVRPVLAEHCWGCHGPKKQMAGLRLDSRAGLLKGGESGPAIDVKRPAESLLIKAVRHEGEVKMPPDRKLPATVVTALTEWIRHDAVWPADDTQPGAADWRSHWAFQPVRDRSPPGDPADRWSRTSIDRFIAARLVAAGISPAPEADRRTWIRRLSFDLTGLPPTPEEVESFLKDDSPTAADRLVGRLLDSPAHGEHLARFWLDVARYADTKGYVFFEENNYPWAYTYRDYVIEAFQRDLPYDRFVMEQLAADRLVGEDRRPLRALGFLTVGGRFMNNIHDVIDDRIDVVTRGLLGLTVSCARCHDHKFDPVPSQDYYSLYGIFASSDEPTVQPLFEAPPATVEYAKFATEMEAREKKLREFVQRKRDELAAGQRRRAEEYLLAAHALRNQPAQENFMLIADGNDLNPKMVVRWQAYLNRTRKNRDRVFTAWHRYAELPEENFTSAARGITLEPGSVHPRVSELFQSPPASMAEVAKRYARLLAETQSRLDATHLAGGAISIGLDADLAGVLSDPAYPPNIVVGDYGDLDLLPDRPSQGELQKLRKDVEQWRSGGPGAPPRAMALIDAARPVEPRVFLRGNPYNLGPAVPRRFLECLSGSHRADYQDGSGRLELARAIVDSRNPLTARVFVNRIWQLMFGQGLVTTPGDFGLRGNPPSHPELLDHLASRFMADGWSTRKLIRWITNSAVYRQASVAEQGMKVDPDNTLLWKMNRRRLGLEPMRDSLLSVAGRLDRRAGGPSVANFLAPIANRRTLYAHLDRLNLPGIFRTFDFPAPDSTSARRDQTTVPPQALFLMNHPFVAECAANLLRRPDVAGLSEAEPKWNRIFMLVYGRTPTTAELALALEAVPAQRPDAAARFVHALMMSNEFLFLD